MFRWRRGNSRGCCVVVPIGCLLTVLLAVTFSGLAVAALIPP